MLRPLGVCARLLACLVPMPGIPLGGHAEDGPVPFSFPKNSGEKLMARASKDATAALRFLAGLTIPEGRPAGKRMRLASYQRDFVCGAFAPGVAVALLSIRRGNAKTALAAGIALGHLTGEIAPQPKREIIFAARNRDQAKTAFGFLVGFIQGLPEDQQAQFTIRRGSRLEVETDMAAGGLARVIPADDRSILGGAPTLAILDERAAWEREKGDSLENAILSGLGKRDGRALIISTSAADDVNTFRRWLDDPPAGCFVQEHRPPPGLPADDPESLLIANPGSREGIGASTEWLVAQAKRAIARGGSALSSFRNLNRNERVSSDDRSVLITIDEWLAAEVSPDSLPKRDGPVILGVDLGGSRSMSSAALFWPLTGRLEAEAAFPSQPGLADRGAADGGSGRYTEMADRGELVTMGDTTVPVARFLADVVARLDGQAPAAIVGDRFRHAEFIEALRGAGLERVPCVWRVMGWRDGSEDVERFRRALFEGRIRCVPSLLLRSAFAGAITLVDPAGNHKLVRGRSTGRIDAAAATVIAVAQGVRMLGQPEGKTRVSWA